LLDGCRRFRHPDRLFIPVAIVIPAPFVIPAGYAIPAGYVIPIEERNLVADGRPTAGPAELQHP